MEFVIVGAAAAVAGVIQNIAGFGSGIILMMILPHKPGALYKVLARLYTLGINVTKLESRPIPDREFEFMFYFDLDTSIYSEEYVQLMCELDELCEEFKYLGSYTEVI